MGRTAIQHESAQTAIAQPQARAVLNEGRAVVASAQQSAHEALHHSEVRVIADAPRVLQVEQRQFGSSELELQRSWYRQGRTARHEH